MARSRARKGQASTLQCSVLPMPLTVTVVSTLLLSYFFPFSPVNKVRYHHDQLDVHHSAAAAGIIPPQPQYDYSLNQQPPMLDTLDLPNSGSARHVTFPSPHYPLQPRNLGIEYPPPASRIPTAPHPHAPSPVDYRYTSATERRLPGGSSHDQSYNRPSGNSALLPMDSDHRSSLVASSAARQDVSPTAEASTSSREPRKEISSVVIACRQWYVSLSLFIKPFNGILTA